MEHIIRQQHNAVQDDACDSTQRNEKQESNGVSFPGAQEGHEIGTGERGISRSLDQCGRNNIKDAHRKEYNRPEKQGIKDHPAKMEGRKCSADDVSGLPAQGGIIPGILMMIHTHGGGLLSVTMRLIWGCADCES